MTQQVGRRSHRGFYRKTADITGGAVEAISKWRMQTEIHRQTACIKFWRDERVFFWHPKAKQFRREGEAAWTKLPPGKGVTALLVHLFGKQELPGVPHFGSMCDPPLRPVPHATNTSNPIDFPSLGDTIDHPVMSAAGSARASTGGAAGEPESQSVGHARAENFARRSANEQRAGGPPQMDDYDYEDPMTFEDGGAHWGSDS